MPDPVEDIPLLTHTYLLVIFHNIYYANEWCLRKSDADPVCARTERKETRLVRAWARAAGLIVQDVENVG